jgi:hypothetical protein
MVYVPTRIVRTTLPAAVLSVIRWLGPAVSTTRVFAVMGAAPDGGAGVCGEPTVNEPASVGCGSQAYV